LSETGERRMKPEATKRQSAPTKGAVPGYSLAARAHGQKRDCEETERRRLLERLRYELAQEVGLGDIRDGDLGRATTAQCGKFGALLRVRMEQLLKNRHLPKS
jgi:hypothetical protein